MKRALHLLALLPLLASAACGSTTPADDDQLGAASYASDELVLQVRQSGGFVPVGWDFRSVPTVSVYGDGRVIVPGPEIAVFPGPALPSVQVGRLEPEQVRRLVDDGRAAVEDGADYGQPPIADAPTTVVTVGPAGDREVVGAAALAEAAVDTDGSSGVAPPDGGGLTSEQQELRNRLSQYVAEVQELAGQDATQPYEPEAMAVLALPYGDRTGMEGEAPEEVVWPGPPLAEGQGVASGTCLVVDEDSSDVREAAAGATQETPWLDGGQLWRLALRPLLPHERSCDDVTEAGTPTGP